MNKNNFAPNHWYKFYENLKSVIFVVWDISMQIIIIIEDDI